MASEFLDEALGILDGDNAVRRGVGGGLLSFSPALHIITDEICSNIVKHSGATGFEVGVGHTASPAGVKLVFADDGVAYDPLTHVDPDTTLPVEKRPIGGLGILLVKKMSDFVGYERVRERNVFTVGLKFPAA